MLGLILSLIMKKRYLILLALITMSTYGFDRLTGEKFASRSEVIGQNGMIATSHPLATQIGLDILKKNGTAIDAAIAANIALGLMEPTGSGIGGDLFAIVWDAKEKKLYGLNSSGPAPKSLNTENKITICLKSLILEFVNSGLGSQGKDPQN